MNKIQKLIAHITSKKWIRVIIMFLIVWWFFASSVYAADAEISKVSNIAYYMQLLLSMLSWVWIILANLAGKLMTNDILYWAFLHLDASLWTLWNIMKNFANFALWFMVLYAIVQNIFSGPFGKDAWERSPINTIKKTLIAGVLIQSSWFLMWAVVDLSTIMTSAIWSFPSQFIAADSRFQWNINTSLKSLQKSKLIFNPKSEWHILEVKNNENQDLDEDEIKKLLDTITPSYDSVSWPLLFIWLAVFDFNEFELFDTTEANLSWSEDWWDLFLSIWLWLATIIFFSLMMLFIFMFNLFRLIMLWIIIPLLPIIILLKVFKITDKLGGWGKWMDLSKFMDIKNIITLIFKPVIMVWSLSLILVILILIKNIISPNGDKTWKLLFEDQWNMVIETTVDPNDPTSYNSNIKSEWIINFSMSWVKKTFADIIVYLFGLFLIYFLVKMVVSIKTGISFIDDALDNTFKSFETILTSIPIIPVAWWIGINALKQANIGEAATRLAWIDIAWQQSRISSLLGLWWTFSSLNTGMTKKAWLHSAVSTAGNMGYTSYSEMTKSKEFLAKMDEWNNYPWNTTNSMRISTTDITNAFKWDYGSETQTSADTKPVVKEPEAE